MASAPAWWIIETPIGAFAFQGTADAAALRCETLARWGPATKRYARGGRDQQMIDAAKRWAQTVAVLDG